ncbi:MAG: hypothetical protein GWP17_04985 [Aquificales bacterium]|nr:hypothetical protein [Aquificales bacterium]
MNEKQTNRSESVFFFLNAWWRQRQKPVRPPRQRQRWLPTPGNILFSLLLVGLLILTQQAWATSTQSANATGASASATTINYQGRLAAPDGTPKNGTFGMSFALWDAASSGSIIWGPENHSAVPVTDGLFNVGLGSQTSGGIPTTVWNGDRYLAITVSGETLTPRELIRSVPIAGMALTISDGAVTTPKIVSASVTRDKLDMADLIPVKSGNFTYIPQNGERTETYTIDISQLGLSGRPKGIAQVTNGTHSHTVLVHYDYDNSTATEAKLVFFRPDGGNLPATNLRIIYFLWE